MAQKPESSTSHHILSRAAHNITHHGLSVAVRIVFGLAILIAIGSSVLMLPGIAVGRMLTFNEAIFTSTSALTVTGLSIITPAADLTLFGKLVLLAMIQTGGVGFMFLAIVMLRLMGRQIYLRDRMALSSSLGLDSPDMILTTLRRVLYGVLLVELLGAILLGIHWTRYFPPLQAFSYGLFHSISAFCNAGFDLFSGAVDQNGVPFDGIPTDTISLAIMGSIIWVGGLGIPVISELFELRKKRRLSLNVRVTLVVVIGLTLFGWLTIFLSEALAGNQFADTSVGELITRSLFQSVSNRTAGFAGLPNFTALHPTTVLVIIGMMFIGCAPASMGGGITTGTFSVLLVSFGSYVRGHDRPTISRRTLDETTILRASAIVTLSIMLLVLVTWLLLLTHPQFTFEQALFEAVSAFATCGLTLGVTGELNGFGRILIMILMFWGRLGPLTLVIAVAQRNRRHKRLIQYPEEQILIG
ncbi:MAG: TrkH family potassium uptake protein [Candidatus Promineifilaceae bacterium]